MAKGKLFEYAVLHHPKPTKDTAGNEVAAKSEILTPITSVLANNGNEVSILAGRSIPDKYLDKLEEVEIIVRPF